MKYVKDKYTTHFTYHRLLKLDYDKDSYEP